MTDIANKVNNLRENVQELIESLPEDVRTALKVYLDTMVGLSDAEMKDAVEKWMSGDVEAVYTRLVHGMTTEQLSSEMDRIIAELRAANKDNFTYVDIQKTLILKAFLSVLKLVKAIVLASLA